MVRRHALIVGIDHYANLGERYQLQGCANDARAVAAVLQGQHGFTAENVQLLLNAQATRAALLAAMDALVARIDDGDVVHVHFSGHGSTRSNANGSEGAGHDSTLMPHDSGRGPAPDRDILDDEVHAWLDRLATRTHCVSLVFDCCHSGTLGRSASAGKVRSVPAFRTAPAAASARTNALTSPGSARTRGLRIGDPRHVMLSACRDDEEAHESPPAEHGTPPHGALTWCLVRALTHCAAGSTWRDLFEQVAPEVRDLHANQNPQLQGHGDLELFGQCDVAPLGSVVVTAVDGDDVTLDAGAVHGITVGSRWQLHAQGAKQDAPGVVLATLQVRALGAVASSAAVLERLQPPEVGMRAIAAGHATDDGRAPVLVVVSAAASEPEHARDIEAVRAALASSHLCRLATAEEDAAFRLTLLVPGMPAGSVAASLAPVQVERPSWALVDAQGTLVAPIHALDTPGIANRVRENVEARIRFRNLLALRNSDHDSRLRGMLGLRLYRRVGPGTVGEDRRRETWEEALPAADGEVHFRVGDGISLRITNRAPQAVFVAALDFDARATIATIFPDDGTSTLLAANTSISVGLPADGWSLDVLPLEPADDGAPVATARRYETIKVFASTSAADFRMLRQEGTRSAGTSRGAWTAGEDWTTTMRSFVVDP